MCRVLLYREHASANSGRPEAILDAMSWVTIIWAMIVSACLTLVLVWWGRRDARANLLLSLLAVAVAVFAGCELWMMRAESPVAFWHGGAVAQCARLGGVGVAGRIRATLVRLYLRAGRLWSACTACSMRTLSLILNSSDS